MFESRLFDFLIYRSRTDRARRKQNDEDIRVVNRSQHLFPVWFTNRFGLAELNTSAPAVAG